MAGRVLRRTVRPGSFAAGRRPRAAECRRVPPLQPRPLGLEAGGPVAMGAARQPVERQSPSHRGLRLCRARRGRRGAWRVSLRAGCPRARRTMRVRRGSLAGGGGRAARGQLLRRADVDSLARSLEVRRARVPVLSARCRACRGGHADGGGPDGLGLRGRPRVDLCRPRLARRRRSGGGLRGRRGRGAGMPARRCASQARRGHIGRIPARRG